MLATAALQADVTLAWDPDSDPSVIGYRLYYGTTSGVYTQNMEAGSATSMLVSNLVPGQTYYFAVTAYNASSVESGFSNQVTYMVPALSVVHTSVPSSATTTGAAQIISPAPGSISTSSVVFTWTAGDATKYALAIGSSPLKADYYRSRVLRTFSCMATNLPTDGRMLYVTLSSKLNGSWTYNQYVYTTQTSPTTATPAPTPTSVDSGRGHRVRIDNH